MQLGMMMMPVSGSPDKFIDKYGFEWIQKTNTGYQRQIDKLFIPHLKFYNHNQHSVAANKIRSENIKNKVNMKCIEILF